jgi:glycosyltransferase involved in cell wall biosynthesis
VPSPQLSVVVPTYKERGNVAELVRRLDLALAGIAWEVIFVDDNSPDGTAAVAKEIAAAGYAGALPAPGGPPRLGRGLHRRHVRQRGALCGGDRWRLAA